MSQGPVSDSRALGRDERRLVTVLFADLAGFTGLAEHRDPEELQELLNSCFDALVPCVERYEGTVDKFIGDAMMVLFGAPVAHENDAERAIRTAIDIRSALAEFNREFGLELAVHQGINTGLVLAGSVGGGQRHDYSVIGDTVNIASRLEDLSAPNEILVGPDTYALAGSLFDIEEADTVTVRGRVQPVQVRRVLGEAPTSVARVLSGLRAPMVGREQEFEAFSDALRAIQDGQGRVLYICGEAGLGKSLLVAEARRATATDAVTWLEGQATSMGQNVSYQPFKQMIEDDIEVSADDDTGERLTRLERRIAQLMPNARKHELDFLAALLGVETSEHRDWLTSFQDSVFRQRLHGAIAAYVRGLARERPLVLVFEDLHWVDESSASAINALLPLVESVSILICLVSRSHSEVSALDPQRVAATVGGRFAEIRLNTLTSSESSELVVKVLGTPHLPAGLQRLVDKRAEGNPFFIQEILHSLVMSGRLKNDTSGGWRMSAMSDRTVPNTLAGIITSRVDRLPDEVRSLLRTASVLGRSFQTTAISDVASLPRQQVARHLHYLQDMQLLRTTPEDEEEFAFTHALAHAAVYESIPMRERRAMHERIAQTIESRARGGGVETDLLAYHYSKAENWGRAREYLVEAGNRMSSLRTSEATEYYRQALQALLGSWSALADRRDDEDSLDWLLDALMPLRWQRRLTSIQQALEEFHVRVTSAFGPSDRRTLTVAELLAMAYNQKAMWPQAISLLESTLKAREDLDGPSHPSLPRMLAAYAVGLNAVGKKEEAERCLLRGIALIRSDPSPDKAVLSALLNNLSYCYGNRGEFARAREVIEEALADEGGSFARALLLANQSGNDIVLGLAREAEHHAKLASETGSIWDHAFGQMTLGCVLGTFGKYLEARGPLERSVEVFEELEDTRSLGAALSYLAECQLQLGLLDQATQPASRAVRLLREHRSLGLAGIILGEALWTQAGIELARGNLRDAQATLDEATSFTSEEYGQDPILEAQILSRRAEVELAQRRHDQADRYIRQALDLLADLGGDQHALRQFMLKKWERLTAEAR